MDHIHFSRVKAWATVYILHRTVSSYVAPVVYITDPVQASLWAVGAEEYAQTRPARKESNVPKPNSS